MSAEENSDQPERIEDNNQSVDKKAAAEEPNANKNPKKKDAEHELGNDELVDEWSEDSFPGSDAPSNY